jgi:hypothetical protein
MSSILSIRVPKLVTFGLGIETRSRRKAALRDILILLARPSPILVGGPLLDFD